VAPRLTTTPLEERMIFINRTVNTQVKACFSALLSAHHLNPNRLAPRAVPALWTMTHHDQCSHLYILSYTVRPVLHRFKTTSKIPSFGGLPGTSRVDLIQIQMLLMLMPVSRDSAGTAIYSSRRRRDEPLRYLYGVCVRAWFFHIN